MRWSAVSKRRSTSISLAEDEDDQDGQISVVEPPKVEELFCTVDEAIEKIGFGPYQVVMMSFSGLIWTVEAFEILILSVLSASLKCEWGLSSVEEASLTSFVFVGFMIGAVLFGIVADVYGRKRCLFLVSVLSAAFGLLSAFAPNFAWMIFLRCMLGIAAGGSAQGTTFCIEFLPAKTRAVTIILTAFFWMGGAIGIVVIAMLTVPTIGWRWLLGFAAIPVTVMSFVVPFVPSSPRYLISKGKKREALRVLNIVARFNCKPRLRIKLLTDQEKEERVTATSEGSEERTEGGAEKKEPTESDHLVEKPQQQMVGGSVGSEEAPSDGLEVQGLEESASPVDGQKTVVDASQSLPETEGDGDDGDASAGSVSPLVTSLKNPCSAESSSKSLRSVLHLWQTMTPAYLFKNGMWKSTVLLWPIWLLTTAYYYGIILLTTAIFQYDKHCPGSELPQLDLCKVLDQDDYNALVWTSTAEAPGIIFTLVILIFIGRKKVMALEFLILTVTTGLLFVCGGRIYLTIVIFVCRGLIAGIFQALFVYTPEVYPTKVRALGLGTSSTFGRIGGIVVPYIAQVLFPASDIAGFCLFMAMALVCAVLLCLLPIETKGRSLKDVAVTH